jgi:hypothetical protein
VSESFWGFVVVLGFLLLMTLIEGCGIARPGDRVGVVNIGPCQIIVEDMLGELPPSHGGPYSRSMSGTGVMCTVRKFN